MKETLINIESLNYNRNTEFYVRPCTWNKIYFNAEINKNH